MTASENLYTKHSIRTVTGRYVNILDPKPEMICIEDIAHGLANTPRFAGQLPEFYSVAQHSLACSRKAHYNDALEALMHDASEAYLGDLAGPIKDLVPGYVEIENRLMTVIAEKFGFAWPMPESVKKIDRQQLEWEWEYLMIKKNNCLWISQSEGERRFLNAFNQFIRYHY